MKQMHYAVGINRLIVRSYEVVTYYLMRNLRIERPACREGYNGSGDNSVVWYGVGAV